MSKNCGHQTAVTAARAADLVSSSLDNLGQVALPRRRTPSVAAKLRLVARYAALAVLARMWISLR
jgi:hypothetical protein